MRRILTILFKVECFLIHRTVWCPALERGCSCRTGSRLYFDGVPVGESVCLSAFCQSGVCRWSCSIWDWDERKAWHLIMEKVLDANGAFTKAPVPAALVAGVTRFLYKRPGDWDGLWVKQNQENKVKPCLFTTDFIWRGFTSVCSVTEAKNSDTWVAPFNATVRRWEQWNGDELAVMEYWGRQFADACTTFEKKKENLFLQEMWVKIWTANESAWETGEKEVWDFWGTEGKNNQKRGEALKEDSSGIGIMFFSEECSDAHLYAPISNLLDHTLLRDKTLFKKNSNFAWHISLSWGKWIHQLQKTLSGHVLSCEAPTARGEKLKR